MKEYYERYPILKKIKVKKDETDDTKKKDTYEFKVKESYVGIINAHYILSGIEQEICVALVNLAESKTKKAAADLYTITEDILMDNIKLNKDFNYTFGRFLDNYNSKESYGTQLRLQKKNVNQVFEKLAFNGKSNVVLDGSAYNFLMYILLSNRLLLAETAFQMSQYGKKSRVDDRAILYTLKTVYVGNMLKSLYRKAEDVSNLVKGLKNETETVKPVDIPDDESDDESNDESTKAKSKSKSKKEKVYSDSEKDSESESDKKKSKKEKVYSDSEKDSESESDKKKSKKETHNKSKKVISKSDTESDSESENDSDSE
jgi:hypothetical protein